jgi:serine/threonine protein kinase
VTSESDPWIGREIGSYRIERLLGRGGMGRVYVGHHPTIGSRVAIKILSEDAVQSPDLVERFLAEARTVGALRHDHIAAVHDFHTVDGRPAIVMELVDGRSLREIVKAGAVEIADVVSWSIDVLAALGATHAIGVIHRDLKPDNIMITPSGRAMLLDFGIAKLAGDSQGAPRTRTGAVIGTPQYMSPEQIQGEPIDLRSDIYSLGIVMYELLGRKRPFDAESDFEMMIAHVETEPPPLEKLRPELPRELVGAVKRALAKRPADRFSSAGAMAKALGDTSKRFDEFATPTFADKPSPSTDAPTRAAKPRVEKVDLAPTEPASSPTPARSKRPLILVGLAVAAIAALVLVTKKSSSPKAAAPVVAVSPTDAAAPADLLASARAAEGEGKLELAIARYVEAYETTKDAEVLFRIGELYERMDRIDDAVRSYERYIASAPPERSGAANAKIARLRPPIVDAGVVASPSRPPTTTRVRVDAGVPEPAIVGDMKSNCHCYADDGPAPGKRLCNKASYTCACVEKPQNLTMCPSRYVVCPEGRCAAGVRERRSFSSAAGAIAYGCAGNAFFTDAGKDGEPCTAFDDDDLTADPSSAATAPARTGAFLCEFCSGDASTQNWQVTGRTGERCKGVSTRDGNMYAGHLRCP